MVLLDCEKIIQLLDFPKKLDGLEGKIPLELDDMWYVWFISWNILPKTDDEKTGTPILGNHRI